MKSTKNVEPLLTTPTPRTKSNLTLLGPNLPPQTSATATDSPREQAPSRLADQGLAPLPGGETTLSRADTTSVRAVFALLQSGYTAMSGLAHSRHLMEKIARSPESMKIVPPSSSQLGWPRADFTWSLLDSWPNPKDAGAFSQGDALAYVKGLASEALQHRAVKHPYLEALSSGDLPDTRWALADFARQYPGYAKHFPRYLTSVISQLTNPRHRDELLANLTEESGIYDKAELIELENSGIQPDWIVGRPHPELFDRFRKALGVPDSNDGNEPDQVICWREMFLSLLANGSPAEAVGALGLGTEQIVSTIYLPFSRAIGRLKDLSPRDTVFFPLHTAVDDHHQKTLQNIAADLVTDASTARELRRGMLKALSLRSVFWDWMHSRALNPADAGQVLF